MDLSPETLTQRLQQIQRLNTHLTFRISRMSKLLEVEGIVRLQGSGITLTCYRMMLVIEIFEEISVSDLSKIMVIDRAQISRAATDLIERGLLEARADRASKRKKLLALSDAGREKFETLNALFADRQETIEGLLTDDDLKGLWQAIDKITNHLAEKVEAA
jgi:DNA-binding MarR family transcriptional regulator